MMRRVFAAVALVIAGCAGPQVQPREAPKPEAAKVLPHDPAPVAHLDPVTCSKISAAAPFTVLYPEKAWAVRQEGWVHLRFDVDSQGVPANVRKLGSSPPGIFDDAALEMLAKARFSTPDLKDCEFVFGFDSHEAPK